MMLRIGSRGFTLVEVLITVSLLGVGLILILQGYATSLNAVEKSQAVLEALQLLKENMNLTVEKAKSEGGIIPREENGEYNEKYKWALYVAQSKVASNLCDVKLTVFWQEGENKGSVSAVTLLEKK